MLEALVLVTRDPGGAALRIAHHAVIRRRAHQGIRMPDGRIVAHDRNVERIAPAAARR